MRALPARSLFGTLSLVLALSACASAGGSGTRPAGSTPDRIVQEELATVSDLDAYDAVQRLRPSWLRTRANTPPPVLYINGSRYGNDLSGLRSLQARAIQQLERVSAQDATTRYGTGHLGGAVLVTMVGSGR